MSSLLDLRVIGVAASIFFLPIFAIAQSGAAKTPERTIIVLDASGSMWGEIVGGVKIDIAKAAVSDLVRSLDSKIELGLMAYGHRSKGDCTDIELLVPPGPDNRPAILKAIQSLVPKGKTPLSDAVLMAAEFLKYGEEKGTVILVSDGIETCGKDPCAVGEMLAAKGIDFVCHVVGFDLSQEERKQIECLAQKTGGQYFDAKDANGLRDALSKATETVVMNDTQLILSARNADGDLLNGVQFQIYGDKGSEDPKYSGNGGKYRQILEPGKYTVSGAFGALKAEGVVEVPEGETTNYELTFEASGLKAHAILLEGGEILQKGLSWRIFDKPPTGNARQSLAYSHEAEPTFHLPPGTYSLMVTLEETSMEQEVIVEEGKGTEVTVILGAGILVATARLSENNPLIEKGLDWRLMSPVDSEGDRRQVTFSYESKTHLVAPAGKYLLTAKHGDSFAQQEVELVAGKTVEVALTFGAGILMPVAIMNEGGDPVSGSLDWRLLSMPDAEGKRAQVTHSYDKEPVLKVASGEYLLQLTRGSAVTEEDVVIAAGEPTRVTVNLNAGTWTAEGFMAEDSPEAATSSLLWEIFSQPDSEGKRKKITHSYDAKPKVFLSSGKYLVRLERGSASVEMDTEISPGKLREDKMILNAGTVVLKTPANAKKISWSVYRIQADGEKGAKVAHGYKPELRVHLNAGSYLASVELTTDGRNEVSKPFEVTAGKLSEIEIGGE